MVPLTPRFKHARVVEIRFDGEDRAMASTGSPSIAQLHTSMLDERQAQVALPLLRTCRWPRYGAQGAQEAAQFPLPCYAWRLAGCNPSAPCGRFHLATGCGIGTTDE